MPAGWAKGDPKREAAWKKAKAIVKKQYPKIEVDSDRYFSIVMGIAQKMVGEEVVINRNVVKEMVEDARPSRYHPFKDHWESFSLFLRPTICEDSDHIREIWKKYVTSKYVNEGHIGGPREFFLKGTDIYKLETKSKIPVAPRLSINSRMGKSETSYYAALGFLASEGHDVKGLTPSKRRGRGSRVNIEGLGSEDAVSVFKDTLKASGKFDVKSTSDKEAVTESKTGMNAINNIITTLQAFSDSISHIIEDELGIGNDLVNNKMMNQLRKLQMEISKSLSMLKDVNLVEAKISSIDDESKLYLSKKVFPQLRKEIDKLKPRLKKIGVEQKGRTIIRRDGTLASIFGFTGFSDDLFSQKIIDFFGKDKITIEFSRQPTDKNKWLANIYGGMVKFDLDGVIIGDINKDTKNMIVAFKEMINEELDSQDTHIGEYGYEIKRRKI